MEKTSTLQDWETLLLEQATSGLSKKDFCSQRNINPAKFYYWQRRIKGSSRPSHQEDFVAHEGFTQLQPQSAHELTFCLKHGELRVRSQSLSTLAGIVQQLCDA